MNLTAVGLSYVNTVTAACVACRDRNVYGFMVDDICAGKLRFSQAAPCVSGLRAKSGAGGRWRRMSANTATTSSGRIQARLAAQDGKGRGSRSGKWS